MDSNDIILILVTAANTEEAEQITNTLVEKKLIACGNIVSPVFSIFHWEGNVSKEDEVLIMLKTQRTNFDRIQREVKSLHSYDTPEIIAIPVIDGSEEYLNWVRDETT